MRVVEEEEPLARVEGVERDVGRVPLLTEERVDLSSGLARRDEVEVAVAPRERIRQAVGRAEDDRDAADEAKRDTVGLGACEQPLRLLDDVGLGRADGRTIPTARRRRAVAEPPTR